MSQGGVDFKYLAGENISGILSQGLTVLYKIKPEYPIKFYAKWLLNYCATENSSKLSLQEENLRQELIGKHKQQTEYLSKEQAIQEAKKKSDINVEEEFKETIKNHLYHEELLEHTLPDFIAKQRGFAGVYIGKLDYAIKTITHKDEEELAHLDQEQPKLIHYIGASKDHKFMIGKKLAPETGVTYDIFKPKEKEPPTDGSEPEPLKEEPIYISDVTKEPRMVYFRIPKLGAFYASSIIYQSYFSDSIFDEGLKEKIRVQQEREIQRLEKEEFEKSYHLKIQDLEDGSHETAEAVNQYNETKWPEINEIELPGIRREFALCADTLGQDQEFSIEDKKYLDDFAKQMATSWQKTERKLLSIDIDNHLRLTLGFNAKEYFEDYEIKMRHEVEEKGKELHGDVSDDEKSYMLGCAEVDFHREYLLNEEVRERLKEIRNFRLIKYRSLIQNAFFLVGYTKDQINNKNTNVIFWKETRTLINDEDFFARIGYYQYKGPKPKVPEYAMGNRILKRLTALNLEEIDNYNYAFGVLYRFMKKSLEVRELDIKLRRSKVQAAKQFREEKMKEKIDMNDKKQKEFEEFKTSIPEEEWGEEKIAEFEEKWIENNIAIEIPDEVNNDVDDDWEFEVLA